MKINNLNVNTKAIANGLYEIVCDAGEESLVSFNPSSAARHWHRACAANAGRNEPEAKTKL